MREPVAHEALEAARGYEQLFVPALFAPWTQHLVDAANVHPGQRVLDVACGTGVLARHAHRVVGDAGRVYGIDPAPGMIAVAEEIAPEIEWALGSAEQLDFADGAFDAVLSQFGMMFFADHDRALAEMQRVLVSGGKVAVAVWNSPDHNPAHDTLSLVLDELVSKAAGDAVRLPFSMGDVDALAKLFERAGFADVTVDTRSEQGRFPSARTMVEAELRGWLPLFDINLSEAQIADVLAKADSRLSDYVALSGETDFPTSAHIVIATKS